MRDLSELCTLLLLVLLLLIELPQPPWPQGLPAAGVERSSTAMVTVDVEDEEVERLAEEGQLLSIITCNTNTAWGA